MAAAGERAHRKNEHPRLGARAFVRACLCLGLTAVSALATSARAQAPAAAPATAQSTASPSTGADTGVPTMTLPECLAYAKTHAPDIRMAEARLKAQVAAAESVGAAWYPSVGVTAQLFGASANNWTGTFVGTRSFDLPRVGGTRANTTEMTPYASTIVAAGFNQTVFEFGRIAAQRAAQDALVRAEQQRTRQDALTIAFSVEEAFVAVLASKVILHSSDEARARAQAIRDQAEAQVKAGLRPQGNLARADADLARIEALKARADGNVRLAENVLAATIGSEKPYVTAKEAPRTQAEMPSLNEAIVRARSRSPRVLRVLAELEAEEKRTKAIGAETRPTLYATASASLRAGGQQSNQGTELTGKGFLPYVPNYDVGLVLSWPIFDGAVSGREDAQRAREELKREELRATEYVFTTEVRRAYVELDTSRSALASLDRAVSSAKQNYDQVAAQFAVGLGNAVDVAQASLLVVDAETNLAAATFQLARARAQLGRLLAEDSR